MRMEICSVLNTSIDTSSVVTLDESVWRNELQCATTYAITPTTEANQKTTLVKWMFGIAPLRNFSKGG